MNMQPFNSSSFKGHVITAVGWNNNTGGDDTTSTIVLGTSKGCFLLSLSTQMLFKFRPIDRNGY